MNTEERLHEFERLIKKTVARNIAQHVVISCLVSSHPNKAQLAKEFRKAKERAAVKHLNDEMVTDEASEFIQKEIEDFIWIAEQHATPGG